MHWKKKNRNSHSARIKSKAALANLKGDFTQIELSEIF